MLHIETQFNLFIYNFYQTKIGLEEQFQHYSNAIVQYSQQLGAQLSLYKK